MSQVELVENSYFRQATNSHIKASKREVSSSEILLLSFARNKPISFFYPLEYCYLSSESLNPEIFILEQELLLQTRRLSYNGLRKFIAQARALADLDR